LGPNRLQRKLGYSLDSLLLIGLAHVPFFFFSTLVAPSPSRSPFSHERKIFLQSSTEKSDERAHQSDAVGVNGCVQQRKQLSKRFVLIGLYF